MRALSTETDTDNGTSRATCWEMGSTGPDLRIRCGLLPLPEPQEFAVRSSALARLGFPQCSVSSRQSHELRTCSPPTKLGTCKHRSQNRRCVKKSSSAPLSRYVSQSGSGTARVFPQLLMQRVTKIAERRTSTLKFIGCVPGRINTALSNMRVEFLYHLPSVARDTKYFFRFFLALPFSHRILIVVEMGQPA